MRKTGPTATFTFPANGSFEVEVEVEHGSIVAEITKIVTVGSGTSNPPPGTGSLDFTFSPQSPAPGQEVTFTATGDTAGGVYKWKFPGDVRKLGSVVTFTFAAAGAYRVEVEIEHGTTEAEVQKTVTVGGGSNGDPGTGTGALDFSFSPSNPQAGEVVTFTASGATGGGFYKWKFPGDVRKTGNVVTFVFAASGSYQVELEIEHGSIVSEVQKTVTVGGGSNGDPGTGTGALDFSFSPSNPQAGQVVTFTASGATGGGFYKWKFPGDVRKTGNVVTFVFASSGSYQVELEIEHGSIVSEVQKTVTVGGGSNGDPGTGTGALDFSFSPSAPRAGQAVTFTASGNAGGGTYEWEFPGNVRKTGAVVTFTFPAAGSYEVELEIEHGSSDAEVKKIVRVAP